MSSSRDDLEKVPFLQSEHGPIPANDLAGRRFISFNEDDSSSSELNDLLKIVSLLGVLLAMLVGVASLAHHIHDYHHGPGLGDGNGPLAEECLTKIWRENLIVNPNYLKNNVASSPTKTRSLEAKRSKTENILNVM